MKCGMSSACFIGKANTEDTIEIMQKMGVEEAELFLCCPSEFEADYAKELRKRTDDAGIKVHSVHPFALGYEPQLYSIYERSQKDAEKIFSRIADTARILGAEAYTFHGPANIKYSKFFKLHYPSFAKRTKRLSDIAMDNGVHLAYENVFWCAFSNPDFVKSIDEYEDLSDLRFTFDVKQAMQSKYKCEDYIRAMGERLITVHLCDTYKREDEVAPTMPFKGEANFAAVKKELERIKFAGPLMLEVYASNYSDMSQLEDCYNEVKGFF